MLDLNPIGRSARLSAHAPPLPRVFILCDVRLYRDGLAQSLVAGHHITLVGASDPDHCRPEEIAASQADIVLFDAVRRDRLAAAKALIQAVPTAKLLAFGIPETAGEVMAWASAGAAGYVPRHAGAAQLVAAVEALMRGELRCPPKVAASLFQEMAGLARKDGDPALETNPLPHLTPREIEIIRLIDQGLPNKLIARQLGIEGATVKNHIHNLLEKLGCHRRGAAAAWARRHGIL